MVKIGQKVVNVVFEYPLSKHASKLAGRSNDRTAQNVFDLVLLVGTWVELGRNSFFGHASDYLTT